MDKEIRWRQRYQNLKRGFSQLQRGVALSNPNDIEKQGIIQSFEFTFELSWKTLKDYLESRGVSVSYPRDILKEAFGHELILGDVWMEMLDDRNFMTHSYDEKLAEKAYLKIKNKYYQEIEKLIQRFEAIG